MNERRQECRVTPLGKVRRPQHQKCRHRAVSVSVAKAIQIAHKYKHFCCVLYEPTHRSSSLNYRRCTAMHYIFPFKATVLFVVSKLAQYSYRPLISRKAYGCVYDQYRWIVQRLRVANGKIDWAPHVTCRNLCIRCRVSRRESESRTLRNWWLIANASWRVCLWHTKHRFLSSAHLHKIQTAELKSSIIELVICPVFLSHIAGPLCFMWMGPFTFCWRFLRRSMKLKGVVVKK